ncbi:recombination-associated protein RdgC [Vibrio coralliirubri]|uniref:recombination-associated protein RdgC n=1 Tax=Vibrio coralliirubri TaxID=1516159 RepID=UPI002283575C|nr:recombination-associated protein RdgC [Vibrio coralliirubri]MCY9860950.1 recombination-associated protein RdgC [Vibrio coralliirubri]
MKKFILYRVFGHNLTNENLINFINEKAYCLDEFNADEEYRCGFAPIHKKLEHLAIDGTGFVKATFKIANRVVNKGLLEDAVNKQVKEYKARDVEPNKKEIEAALRIKLKPFGDIKMSKFDIIFDTVNNLIYTASTTKAFEDKFIPFFKKTYNESKFRLFKARLDEDKMATFFTTPEAYLTEGFKATSFVELTKDDGVLVTFKDAELRTDEEFKTIVEKGFFKVHQVDMRLKEGQFMSFFRINKKAMPTSIRVYGTETDSDMNEAAETSVTSSEGKDGQEQLSKEQILYDNLYTNMILLMSALPKIAHFTMDFADMEETAKKVLGKEQDKAETVTEAEAE